MNVRGEAEVGGNVKIISTIKPVSSQLKLIRDCRYRQEFCPAHSGGQFTVWARPNVN